MEKKNLDWSNIGFGYVQTDKRYVSNFKDGAWDEGGLTDDANVVLNEMCIRDSLCAILNIYNTRYGSRRENSRAARTGERAWRRKENL